MIYKFIFYVMYNYYFEKDDDRKYARWSSALVMTMAID